jgi:hypothetical protein
MAPSIKLTIEKDPNHQGHQLVTVEGFGLPDSARTAVIKIRGSDQWSDDNLFTMNVVQFNGYNFSWFESVESKYLNEDWGEDDIYALVEISDGVTPTGTLDQTWSPDMKIKSNTIHRQFG